MRPRSDAITNTPWAPKPISTGLVTVDTSGTIVYANPSSENLILGEAALGRPLPLVLHEAQKFGRLPLGTAQAIMDSLGRQRSRFELGDGREVLMNCSSDAEGSTLIEWWEVSEYIADSRLGQRDPVTGVLSRSAMAAQIRTTAAELNEGQQAALLCIQIDRLRSVGETLGQTTVDKLLKKIAGRLAGQLKQGSHVARLEGETFAVLQETGEHPNAALALAELFLDLLGRPYIAGGQMIHVGASIGIALVPAGITEPDEVLRNASLALLRTRGEEGGTIGLYSAEMDEQVRRRGAMEVELRKALALREFHLVYQPQYEVDGERLVGFEALVRWTHPVYGQVSPGEFIPLAEDIGVIAQMGEWVLQTACREAAGWPEHLTISVNVSPIQFRNPQIVSVVMSSVARAGLAPSRLELEVTEGALLLNSEPIMAIFRQLKTLGVRFAMDDFGTGYSSLSYLQKFPFDKIKIDQSFVRDLTSSADSAAIVRSITALGTSLGLITIAEGVETDEQLQWVKEYGCLQVQGYLTGRPLDVNKARTLALAGASQTGDQE